VASPKNRDGILGPVDLGPGARFEIVTVAASAAGSAAEVKACSTMW
jgi:hypothetical protein